MILDMAVQYCCSARARIERIAAGTERVGPFCPETCGLGKSSCSINVYLQDSRLCEDLDLVQRLFPAKDFMRVRMDNFNWTFARFLQKEFLHYI